MANMVERLKQMRAQAMVPPGMGPAPEEISQEESPQEEAGEQVSTETKGLTDSLEIIAQQASSGELAQKAKPVSDHVMTLNRADHPDISEDAVGDKVVMVLGGTIQEADDNTVSVAVDELSVVHGGKPPLGTGERFSNLTEKLRARGAKSPDALAAWIGRKNLGKERFQQLSVAGRKRHSQGG